MATIPTSRAYCFSKAAAAVVVLLGFAPRAAAETVREHKLFMTAAGPRAAVLGRRRVQAYGADGKAAKHVLLEADVSDAALSLDGARLAACARDGALYVVDLDAGKATKASKDVFCSETSWTQDGSLYFLTHRIVPGGKEPVVSIELRRVAPGADASTAVHDVEVAIPPPPLPPPMPMLPGAPPDAKKKP